MGLLVGTPMYDGRCHSQYLQGMCHLTALCQQVGISLQVCLPCGDALVMAARNTIADRFLRSGADYLVMIDSDIGFEASDVLEVLSVQQADGGANAYDVVVAPYPQKRFDWSSVSRAAKAGLADDDADRLERYASDIQLHLAEGGQFKLNAPVEVTQASTAFMSIRRSTLDRFCKAYPERTYRSGPSDLREGAGPTMTQFFDTAIEGGAETLEADLRGYLAEHPEAGSEAVLAFMSARRGEPGPYVSEDFQFCRLVRRIGLKVWACPWIDLTHTGSHTFRTRVEDLARVRKAVV
ncbi:hypothetical protein B2G71_02585 [Novosphingobium sp. PC22D]|nr:hypothetical protein B2G71_02585 [Novosphingobium sp. PC22D]